MNNPKEALVPNCIPFVFTNLSMYSQYLGKDKVVGFAQPTAEDVEVHTLADHNELAEMMRGPRNHIPRKKQAKYKLPIIPLDNAFITSPADVPGPRRVDLQDADITPGTMVRLTRSVRSTPRSSPKGTRILVEHNWLQWTSIRETAPRLARDLTPWHLSITGGYKKR